MGDGGITNGATGGGTAPLKQVIVTPSSAHQPVGTTGGGGGSVGGGGGSVGGIVGGSVGAAGVGDGGTSEAVRVGKAVVVRVTVDDSKTAVASTIGRGRR